MEIRPVARAAVVGRRRNRFEPRQQLDQLRVGGLVERVRVRVGQVRPERQHPPRQRQDHERLRDHLAREPARAPLRASPRRRRRRRRPVAGRPATSALPTGTRASSARRPRSSCVAVRGVESLANLRLQARLLVEADLEVREDGELRAHLRIALEPPALIAGERLAQVALPLGRVAGPKSVEETLERSGSAVRRALVRDSARTRARSPRTPSGSRARRRRWRARTRRTVCAAQPSGARSASRAGRGRGAAADATSVAIGCSSQRPSPSLRPRCSSRSSPRIVRPPVATPTWRTCTSSRPRRSVPRTPPRDASSSG